MELKAVAADMLHLCYIIDDDPRLICSMANVHSSGQVRTFLFALMLQRMVENMLSRF